MLRTRALTVGLILAIGLGGSAVALAPTALAAAGRPAAQGTFRTWHAAQHAAGFRLHRPTRLHGLARSGRITVTRCDLTSKHKRFDVFATYGKQRHRYLSIDQNNSGAPCSNLGEVRKLRTVRIHGARATLFGACGGPSEPSCHLRNIFLFLTWRRHHVFYQANSHDQWAHVLLNFARSLRRVH